MAALAYDFPIHYTPYKVVSSFEVRPRAGQRLRFAQPVAQISGGFSGLSAISQSSISVIADTIQTQEGYRPGTIAYRNNNPGNLIYVGQPGATLGEGGFARFSDYASGRAALERQIGLYAGRGMTIQSMAETYAPWGHGGNNPDVYAGRIASALGVPAGTTLSSLDGSTGSSGGSWRLPSFDFESEWSDSSMLLGIGAVSLATVVLLMSGD